MKLQTKPQSRQATASPVNGVPLSSDKDQKRFPAGEKTGVFRLEAILPLTRF